MPRALEPDRLDLEMLELIAAMRHVLTSQVHRRFNSGCAATTTQRRLKRLSDAGLVERFQFHRRDGGGIPMCYVIADAGMRAMADRDSSSAPDRGELPAGDASAAAVRGSARKTAAEARPRQARHDVHVGGWALALAKALGADNAVLRGPDQSVLLRDARIRAGTHCAHARRSAYAGRSHAPRLHVYRR